jgi:hypothetical protein
VNEKNPQLNESRAFYLLNMKIDLQLNSCLEV